MDDVTTIESVAINNNLKLFIIEGRSALGPIRITYSGLLLFSLELQSALTCKSCQNCQNKLPIVRINNNTLEILNSSCWPMVIISTKSFFC